jgi:hypothetical protein
MIAAALVMVLASAEPSGFWEDSAATGFVRLASKGTGGSVLGGTHLRLGLGYDAQSFFVEGRGSFQLAFDGINAPFQDLGSNLSFGYRPHGFLEELRLTLWPFNSVTALPVFDWANRIGNTPLEFAPAFSLQASTPVGAVWATTRLRRVLNNYSNTYEVRPDLFFGVNTLLPNGFQLDARAAWFQYGLIPSLAQSGIQKVSDGFVASARLSWKWNEFVGPAMDFDFYATDPWRFERFFVPETRVTRAALWFAVEGGGGAQKLIDPEVFASTKSQPLGWVDAQFRARISETRLFLTGRVHTTSFDAAITPGVPPYVAFAKDSTVAPRLEALAGFDTTWRAARLTPGVLVRLTRPSYVQSPRFDFGGANPPSGLNGPRTVLLYGDNSFGILPFGATVKPQFAVKLSLKWEPVAFITIAGELNIEKDFNSYYLDSEAGVMQESPTKVALRGQLLVRARF